MLEAMDYRCFIGGISWSTSDKGLKSAFEKFGRLTEAKPKREAVQDASLTWAESYLGRAQGLNWHECSNVPIGILRSHGFGFATFDDKATEEAVRAMDSIELDGWSISVDKAQPQGQVDTVMVVAVTMTMAAIVAVAMTMVDAVLVVESASSAVNMDILYGVRGDRFSGGNSQYGPDGNGDCYAGCNRDGVSCGGSGGDRYNCHRSGPYEHPGHCGSCS